MAVSFADDIRPLFRDSPNIDSMKAAKLEGRFGIVPEVRASRKSFAVQNGFRQKRAGCLPRKPVYGASANQ
jgi:hypothetical protein